MMNKYIKMLLTGFICMSLFACANMQTKQDAGTAYGTGIGAGVGAVLGQAIGKNTESTLIGAGIGALVGGLTGNQVGRYMDSQEQELRQAIATSEARSDARLASAEAASVQREQDVLRATLKSETYFDYDKSDIKPGAYPEIQRIATVLNKYPQTTIEVGGHTDSRGSEEYNLRLSERRAAAVKNALVQDGVASQRIRAVGYGESRPISASHDLNRRVEIIITPLAQG